MLGAARVSIPVLAYAWRRSVNILFTLVLLAGLDGTGDLFAPCLNACKPYQDCMVVRYPVNQALDYEALASLVRAGLT